MQDFVTVYQVADSFIEQEGFYLLVRFLFSLFGAFVWFILLSLPFSSTTRKLVGSNILKSLKFLFVGTIALLVCSTGLVSDYQVHQESIRRLRSGSYHFVEGKVSSFEKIYRKRRQIVAVRFYVGKKELYVDPNYDFFDLFSSKDKIANGKYIKVSYFKEFEDAPIDKYTMTILKLEVRREDYLPN